VRAFATDGADLQSTFVVDPDDYAHRVERDGTPPPRRLVGERHQGWALENA
jgi:hypothetical protein